MSKGNIQFATSNNTYLLKLSGEVKITLGSTLNEILDRILGSDGFTSILIDLEEVESIDSTSLGLLAKLSVQTKQQFGFIPTIFAPNEDINYILVSIGFSNVFNIVSHSLKDNNLTSNLSSIQHHDMIPRNKVLSAHKELIKLNKPNKTKFRNLIKVLEDESNYE